MRVIKWGAGKNPVRMTCDECTTEIEVADRDWRDGAVYCPCCHKKLLRPDV